MMSHLFLLHIELWPENDDPEHRHASFAILKKIFAEKIYMIQKDSPTNFLRLTNFGRFHFVALKFIQEF